MKNKSEISNNIREPIKSIIMDGREEHLTHIGQGSTCLVYKNEDGFIFKEFFPLINGYIPAMRRTESGELQVLESVDSNPIISAAYQKSQRGFEDSIRVANIIRETYKNKNADMRIFPEPCNAEHGQWQKYHATAGDVFCEYLEKKRRCAFKEQFAAILNSVCLLTHDVATYHKAGFINLDIKPQNLYVLYNDAQSISAVRNLDFGSALKIKDLLAGIEDEKRKKSAGTDIIVSRINNTFFSTTEQFYYEKSLRNTIKLCVETEDYEKKKNELIRLDAIAVIKILIYALSNDLDDEVRVSLGDENLHLKNKLLRIFTSNRVTAGRRLFEEYNCYFHLYDLISYVFVNSDGEAMMKEIENRLMDILCIIGRKPGAEDYTPRQKEKMDMNKIFAASSYLLEENNLKSVADIYRFAGQEGLYIPPSCGELNYYLVVGEDRERFSENNQNDKMTELQDES